MEEIRQAAELVAAQHAELVSCYDDSNRILTDLLLCTFDMMLVL